MTLNVSTIPPHIFVCILPIRGHLSKAIARLITSSRQEPACNGSSALPDLIFTVPHASDL